MSQMSAISASIAAAVEQQSTATAEIARNVEQAASGTQEVSERIAKVDVAARETGSTANEISGSANELLAQTDTLRTEVAPVPGAGALRSGKRSACSPGTMPGTSAYRRSTGITASFMDGLNTLFSHLMQGEGRMRFRTWRSLSRRRSSRISPKRKR